MNKSEFKTFLLFYLREIIAKIDQFSIGISTYVSPVFIGLISLIVLQLWQSPFTVPEPHKLSLQVVRGMASNAPFQEVLAAARQREAETHFDNKLSEAPFWFLFKTTRGATDEPLVLEFPSRHLTEISCWNARTLVNEGSADRHKAEGEFSAIKAGFALKLTTSLKDDAFLCRANAIGPARVSVFEWQEVDIQKSNNEFYRNSGLLDGGVLILAAFVLITGLVNKNYTHIIFAAWLVINLRMAGLSAGWDSQWLGNTAPQEWIIRLRAITTALYYMLTFSMFRALFKEELTRVRFLPLLRIPQWSTFPLFILSLTMSYPHYLVFLWVMTAISCTVTLSFLVQIVLKNPSRVALWYTTAISISIFSGLYEVIAASMGFNILIGSVNSVTAALASSLLTALAFAEQMRFEHENRVEVQAELEHTFEAIPIGLFTLDLDGRFTSANPAFNAMMNTDVLREARSWEDYFKAGAWLKLNRVICDKSEGELILEGLVNKDSTEVKRFLVNATLARGKIEGSLEDVTEKLQASDHLYFLATHDSLTKIYNRRGIVGIFNEAIKLATPLTPMAMAYLDLDRFKLINDLYGHSAGDEVLQQVTARMTSLVSQNIHIGRVGGDEFVIIFSHTPIATATLICQDIANKVSQEPYIVGDKVFHLECSMGLIEVDDNFEFKDAMSIADRACRNAKNGKHLGLVVYQRHDQAFKQHETDLELTSILSSPTATDNMYLEMQPIMSLTQPRQSLNFEVLLRMRDCTGNLIPTDRLIKAAESIGRMGVIDRWVLNTTLAWMDSHQPQLVNTQFVCVNLSGASLNDESFLQFVYDKLQSNLHMAGQLCLEITETVALHDVENTRRFIHAVRSFGAKVALDDFGSGYTSFSYLKELKTDILKIDGNFIVNMNQHPANVAIVETIVNLAKNMGMKVVAEWAEDCATVQTLTEIGVDYVQGYAIARPQHPDKLLTAHSSANFIKDAKLEKYVALIGA